MYMYIHFVYILGGIFIVVEMFWWSARLSANKVSRQVFCIHYTAGEYDEICRKYVTIPKR